MKRDTMDENLVGYLLNSLDPDEQMHVEDHLRSDQHDRDQVERLRLALAPLTADVDDEEPPNGLVVRTIARVAEQCCRKTPIAPPAPPPTLEMLPRSGWRRI